MSAHDGHRRRLIRRFLEEGLDGFESHNILELVLFFSIPRRDTNALAHRLVDTFGGLNGVFDAPYKQLLEVEGVGENTAALLKMIPQLTRVYCTSQQEEKCLDSVIKAGNYLKSKFIGRREEAVFLVCLDAKSRVIGDQLIHEGSVNSAEVNVRKIANLALQHNAAGVILAHNHPGGLAIPSREDLTTSWNIRDALAPMGITLMDHIIVADQDFVSLRDSGQL